MPGFWHAQIDGQGILTVIVVHQGLIAAADTKPRTPVPD